MNHDLTIVIPTYNAENWIAQTLSCLVAQTYNKWQALIVNDGSSDGTLEIVKGFSRLDERIKFASKENGGTASALNIGLKYILEHRKGSYFLWLSADDLYPIDSLACHNHFINLNGRTKLYFHASDYYIIKDQNQNGLLLNDLTPWMQIPEDKYQMAKFIYQGNYIHGNSIVMSYELVKRVGFFNEKLPFAHDMDYWFRASRMVKIHFLNLKTTITRKHSQQTGKIFSQIKYFDPARIVYDYLQINPLKELFSEFNLTPHEIVYYCASNLHNSPLSRIPIKSNLHIARLVEYCKSQENHRNLISLARSIIERKIPSSSYQRLCIACLEKLALSSTFNFTDNDFMSMLHDQLKIMQSEKHMKANLASSELVEAYIQKVDYISTNKGAID